MWSVWQYSILTEKALRVVVKEIVRDGDNLVVVVVCLAASSETDMVEGAFISRGCSVS